MSSCRLRPQTRRKYTYRVPYGVHQRFDVMQGQHGRVIGGSTFEVRVRRAAALHPVSRIRVTLEKVRILDDKDRWFKGAGEFQFDAWIEFNDDPCRRHFRRLPHKGSYRIEDRKGHNEQIVRCDPRTERTARSFPFAGILTPRNSDTFAGSKS